GLSYSDQPSSGAGDIDPSSQQRQQQKPGVGQRMMGTAEKAYGKMTGDTERVQKGQERQSGQDF
ncbi:hypothetical protein AX14_012687, partial [Amanita brunnescens Koide BX004]